MKILIVCQYFYPEPFRITDIAVELVKKGHSVTVLTGIPNYPEGRFYPGYSFFTCKRASVGGARVKRVPIFPRRQGKAFSLSLNYLSFAANGSLSALRTRRGEYDVVFVYQLSPILMAIPGMVAAARSGAPLVLYVVDLWPESLSAAGGISNGSILRLFGWIVDRAYRKSKTILVTSKGFTEPIVLRGQPLQKLHYVPQYPEEAYYPATVALDDSARSEFPKGFNIVFTGNVGVAQGLDVVLDAAVELKEYADIHWVIIGDGRARVQLEKAALARGLGDRVLFLGRRPMSRIPIYLALSDAALLCLGSEPLYALTLPAKIQSYFACGIPVIGSANGDAARVIAESGAGLVGPAGDAKALARNVLEMYRMSVETRKEYAQHALQYSDNNFRKDRLIAEIEQNLRQAALSSKTK
jgi:colanic acid biosynthesis glycosyl transferase WcaI